MKTSTKGTGDFMKSMGVEVVDLNLDECKQMMRDFIRSNPELQNENMGKL